MTPDQLRSALFRDGREMADDLFDRAVDALAGPPHAEGMPALDFLPARLQVAALYSGFFKGFTWCAKAAENDVQAGRGHC